MFLVWLIVGTATILMGIFGQALVRLLGLRPMSEVMTIPNLKRSSRTIEQIGRLLLITLGVSFLVLGLGESLPNNLSYTISFLLFGLSGLMLLAIVGITIANWNAK